MLNSDNCNTFFFAIGTLLSASVFTVLWLLDSLTHAKLIKVDITDKELQTHRNIMLTSILMEISLVLMYWFHFEVLPLFIAFFITRTIHEFIDELHWHANRCSQYENFLHLGMWISVLTKTGYMFMWGFYYQFEGIWDLHPLLFIWGILLIIAMAIISLVEWKR